MTVLYTPPPDAERALARWAETVGCRLLVLFGSAAAGRAHPRSDLDIGLAFDEVPGPERRLRMIGEIQDLGGNRPVDVVFLQPETNPVLRFEVFRTGRALYEATPGSFAAEAARALALYEDALPFRRSLRKHVARAAGVS